MEEQKITNLLVYLMQHLIIYLNLLPILIRFKTSMLQSDLFDCRDAYIVFKETITVSGNNNRDRKNRSLTFKNNVPFISWIS